MLSALALCPGMIAAAAPAGAKAEVSARHLSPESTLGELLDNPASHAELERLIPVIARSPQIAQARDQTLRGIAPFAPPWPRPCSMRAMLTAKVPAELHIFAEGRHGMGLAMTDPALSVWASLLQTWMESHGLIGPRLATTQ